MIRLLDVENGKVAPTEHCQTIKWLRVIQEKWPEQATKIYAYVFYMACPSQENPYFNLPFALREDTIISDLEVDFDTEEDEIIEAVEKARTLYETPTVRAYKGIATMIDNLSEYMENSSITAGRDGNINSLIRAGKDFQDLRQSFKGVAKDLEAEQQAQVRGSQQLGYDQQQ